jgi:hypothetical protein
MIRFRQIRQNDLKTKIKISLEIGWFFGLNKNKFDFYIKYDSIA